MNFKFDFKTKFKHYYNILKLKLKKSLKIAFKYNKILL